LGAVDVGIEVEPRFKRLKKRVEKAEEPVEDFRLVAADV
jgi:hypothetical protein